MAEKQISEDFSQRQGSDNVVLNVKTSEEDRPDIKDSFLLFTRTLCTTKAVVIGQPDLEDQLNDRLSFQCFVGIDFSTTILDFTTL